MRNSCWINFILGIGDDRVHEDIMKFRRNEIEKLKRNTNFDFERSAARHLAAAAGSAWLSPPPNHRSSPRELHLL
jgi:hypothetical protein